MKEILIHILLFPIIHKLSSWLHLSHARERLLVKLEPWRIQKPKTALSRKRLQNHSVIRNVDSLVSQQARERILSGFANYGLITKERDSVFFNTPLTFAWQKFFTISHYFLQDLVVPALADHYKDQNIACFVILPFPRNRKTRESVDFERALESLLGSRPINREVFTPAIVDKKLSTTWTNGIREGEKILVIQPMAIDDDYVKRAIEYIEDNSSGSIIEILTIIDCSGRASDKRSTNPFERVLIELNLSK
jgi:hypothetical protein